MKKFLCLLAVPCLLMGFTACGKKAADYTVDYGASSIYSREDMEEAVKALVRSFNSWEVKCTLLSVSYAGDETVTEENLDYCNTMAVDFTFDKVIVFKTAFRTPESSEDAGAFESDTLYTDYTWYLAKENGGEWTVVTAGYA